MMARRLQQPPVHCRRRIAIRPEHVRRLAGPAGHGHPRLKGHLVARPRGQAQRLELVEEEGGGNGEQQLHVAEPCGAAKVEAAQLIGDGFPSGSGTRVVVSGGAGAISNAISNFFAGGRRYRSTSATSAGMRARFLAMASSVSNRPALVVRACGAEENQRGRHGATEPSMHDRQMIRAP